MLSVLALSWAPSRALALKFPAHAVPSLSSGWSLTRVCCPQAPGGYLLLLLGLRGASLGSIFTFPMSDDREPFTSTMQPRAGLPTAVLPAFLHHSFVLKPRGLFWGPGFACAGCWVSRGASRWRRAQERGGIRPASPALTRVRLPLCPAGSTPRLGRKGAAGGRGAQPPRPRPGADGGGGAAPHGRWFLWPLWRAPEGGGSDSDVRRVASWRRLGPRCRRGWLLGARGGWTPDLSPSFRRLAGSLWGSLACRGITPFLLPSPPAFPRVRACVQASR